MKPKLLVIAAANNFNFIHDIASFMQDDFEIELLDVDNTTIIRDIHNAIRDTDCIWFEWFDGVVVSTLMDAFTRKKYLWKKKIILRIHRYELFKDHLINHFNFIDPEMINRLVFVSEYVKQIGTGYFPWMEKGVVIPNLIDIDKFPFHDREKGYNLLMLGRISYVKNLPFVLDMFNELLKLDSRYKLHIVGDIHEKELVYYLQNYIQKLKLEGKIIEHGHIPNDQLSEFMKDMHYIVSGSIFESQGVGILEAMATGLKPVIFNFPGAETFFPASCLYMDRKDFVMRIMEPHYNPIKNRDFVETNYSIQEKIGLYKDLIKGVLNDS